ncbi:MAG: beta-ketoacyl synthase chain length factor [Bacteroidetes bacterium]|nr:beta-ketoacyl synthase chain length factor [Bacteroidota bacterium]
MFFINGIGLISPQKTSETKEFLKEVIEYHADYLTCIEPVYRTYIDPIAARRMSRLIKMGIASARMSVAEAGLEMPDAIITGTGLGSVEDTEKILAEITKEEHFLNPTPFIQSTYNTISSQIAINLKCLNYNTTYVHRTFSFESGLIDGMLQIEEGTASDVLIGAIDQMTLNHLKITRRIGLWKMQPVNNLQLMDEDSPGALAGEGSAFFVIGAKPVPSTYCRLTDAGVWINLNGSLKINKAVEEFLGNNGLTPGDIDIVMLGNNGDSNYDFLYANLADQLFPGTAQAWYKHLCGEYHTATGFGLWAAANILKHQSYPEILHLNEIQPSRKKNILIYNQYRNVNHSMTLVQSC